MRRPMSSCQIHTAPGIRTVPSTFSNIISKNIGIELVHRLPAQRVLYDARLSWNRQRFWCGTALKRCETARNLSNTAILLDKQEGTAMKLFSISSFLTLASAAIFSVAGIAQAQYGGSTSGQGSSAGQSGSTGSSSASGQGKSRSTQGGTTNDGMDMGYVDQQKREERSKDAGSPSKDTHVPDFPVDKEGKPKKDPKYEQGGSIGPN
ncbi:hypothetical protein [Nitrosospira sp. NRS527]|uniref:hypothetical protein n=1 Tax=Nitrosospira sp. NRS527 TaxID=155925 RepID=UPI001FCFE2B2|nr:hypothetical protein [Nitrosospira sp. NRS527]